MQFTCCPAKKIEKAFVNMSAIYIFNSYVFTLYFLPQRMGVLMELVPLELVEEKEAQIRG